MRKVLIVGSSGAGKSTLAVKLGAKLGLPVIHLDTHFWRAGWQESPRDEWAIRVAELLKRDEWIMDGNYSSTMAQRVAAADTIILLNFPRALCLFRVVTRSIHYRGKTRPDLHEGCPEKLADWAFLRWIWAYPRRSLPTVLELLRTHESSKTIIVLRSPAEVERYLASVSLL